MNLRGIARAAAAATVTALFIGSLGTPANAEEAPFPGGRLTVPIDGTWAATAPHKGCAGIDTGVAVPGKDGWLFSKPAGEYKDLNYVLGYGTGAADDEQAVPVILVLNSDGIFEVDVDAEEPDAIASALAAKRTEFTKAENENDDDVLDLPTKPAPAGVTGKLTEDGGWVKTPKGWGLYIGFALTDPLLTEGTFDLVRACAAAADPTPSASPTGGPSLPVTGSNTGTIIGVGAGMVFVGAVLFVVYRRRRNIKFVA
jgi:LPXTG-motif cell wall-anchored protein